MSELSPELNKSTEIVNTGAAEMATKRLDDLIGGNKKQINDLEAKREELDEHRMRHPELAALRESYGPIAFFSIVAILAAYFLDVVLLRTPIEFFLSLAFEDAAAKLVWVVPVFIILLELFVGYKRTEGFPWSKVAPVAALAVPAAMAYTFWITQEDITRPFIAFFLIIAVMAHVVVVYGARQLVDALVQIWHRIERRNLESAQQNSEDSVTDIETAIRTAHLDWSLAVARLPEAQRMPFLDHMELPNTKLVLERVLGRVTVEVVDVTPKADEPKVEDAPNATSNGNGAKNGHAAVPVTPEPEKDGGPT